MIRIILHVDMDAFFANIEERENPQFKGKPLVVGADPKKGKGRGVVSTANYLARNYGIHSAMPISWAWRSCPEAIFLPVNMALYQKVSEKIMGIIKSYSEKYEITSLDEAYLDITDICQNKKGDSWKKAEKLAKKLKKEIMGKEKLPSTVGIGPNKMIAKIATNRGKPNGLFVVKPKEALKFISPLDVDEIPGIGKKTKQKLEDIGVVTIKQLRGVPKEKLKNSFGIVGEYFYQRARGIDENPVVNDETVKSIGREHTFEKDTRDSEKIFAVFEKLAKYVFKEVKKERLSFRTITVVCRFSGFETHTKSKTFESPMKNFELLQKEAKKLLLKFLIENPKPVRLIGIRIHVTQNPPSLLRR